MGKIAFLFPGQGSQTVGMGKGLAEKYEKVKEIFSRADSVLGRSLSTLIFNGPQEELSWTVNTQPALVTTSIAILERFDDFGIEPDYVAGHSLGEYSALVAAGVLPFEDAVRIVEKRGRFMEAAYPQGKGAMAAVLGLDREVLAHICQTITATGEHVQLANLNCPGQIVISGTKSGVKQAWELARQAGARRVIPLNVSGPFHSEFMKPAAEELRTLLSDVEFHDARPPVVANVTAAPVTDRNEIKKLLIKQLYSPVLWEDSIRTMIANGADTFIEIGPGSVLSGLVRKIDRSVRTFSVHDEETLEKAVTQLKGDEG